MAKKISTPFSHFSPEQLQVTEENALATVTSVGADEQADLVDAWVAAGNVAAVAAVAREDSAPAPARKAARRGIHVLKSRGITVPEKNTVARPFAHTHHPPRQIEARYAPFEAGIQGSVITIFSRVIGKDCEFVEVFFSDSAGITRAGGGTLSHSKLREWEASRRFRRGYDAVPVPIEWARWRLGQARQQNRRSGVLLPLELERFQHLLTPIPSSDPGHPAAQLGLSAEAEPVRVARSFSLHLEPEFRAFRLPQEVMQEMLSEVGKRLAALGRNAEQNEIEQFLEEEKRAAADRFFQEEVRKRLADQMYDLLLSVHHRAGREKALDVLATREAILTAGLITRPPSEIPFLVGFFDKTLAMLIHEGNGQLSIPMPRSISTTRPVLSAEQLAAIEGARQGA
ncbi:MAG: hypothetical protein RMJ98_21670 [Myxococcales bacterium]|nr:hypothetical protein [Polyangiaceae bacterium]MDW8251913.1 hypothetical protein [Myxococcales bacterium]